STTAPFVLTPDEYNAIHGELDADLDPSLDLGMLLPRDRQYDLGDYRRAIRRLQTLVDVLDALEVAASQTEGEGDVTLPPSAVSDLRELLPAMATYVIERARASEADPREHPEDLASVRARRTAVLGVADRLGVEIPQPAVA
ncbi:MAG: hypothetical protein M3N47_09905, partial [Chloroflexota bacterium]|nr:hypothetical protein [Chloroflexota bacterium]